MAVETRYVVVRNGKDVMSTTNKKSADEYDKMLDAANALFDVIEQSGIKMSDDDRDELSIFLAKNKDDVLVALGAKKATPKKKPAMGDKNPEPDPQLEAKPPVTPSSGSSFDTEDEQLDILGSSDNQDHLITVPSVSGIELDLSEAMESGDGLLDSAKKITEQAA